MIHLHELSYVRVGASDLAKSVRFAQEIVGLELVGQEDGCAYLRGDDRDHNICYVEGDPRNYAVGFEIRSLAELDQASQILKGLGVEYHLGSDKECAARRVEAFLHFKDPTGNGIDLAFRPHHSGIRYFPSRDAGITSFGHIGLNSSDPVRDEKFWTQVFNVRVSDRVAGAALMRIDPVHHKIALFPTDRPGIQHINFQVGSVDDVMNGWYFLQENGVDVVFGPGRHPTSTAIFVYFLGPDDNVYEYSHGVKLIEDEENHVPRQFPAHPRSFCMWGSLPKLGQFKVKKPEKKRAKTAADA